MPNPYKETSVLVLGDDITYGEARAYKGAEGSSMKDEPTSWFWDACLKAKYGTKAEKKQYSWIPRTFVDLFPDMDLTPGTIANKQEEGLKTWLVPLKDKIGEAYSQLGYQYEIIADGYVPVGQQHNGKLANALDYLYKNADKYKRWSNLIVAVGTYDVGMTEHAAQQYCTGILKKAKDIGFYRVGIFTPRVAGEITEPPAYERATSVEQIARGVRKAVKEWNAAETKQDEYLPLDAKDKTERTLGVVIDWAAWVDGLEHPERIHESVVRPGAAYTDSSHLTLYGYTKRLDFYALDGGPNNPDNPGKGDKNKDKSKDTYVKQVAMDYGSFYKVKEYIQPEELRKDAVFNPPPLHKRGHRGARIPGLPKNPKTFFVRDPVLEKQISVGETDWTSFKTNYGFQFHYNPQEFTETYEPPMEGDPIWMQKQAAEGAVLSGTDLGATFEIRTLLNRVDDMLILPHKDWRDHYPEGMTDSHRENLLKRGTQYDLEFFFRMCNGDPQDTWRGKTADWGSIIPTLLVVCFGDNKMPGTRKFRAMVKSVSWTHKRFAPGMIPMLTEVSFSMERLIDAYYTSNPESTVTVDEGGKRVRGDSANLPKGAKSGWKKVLKSQHTTRVFYYYWKPYTYDYHTGIDFGGSRNTPVYAPRDGKVAKCGFGVDGDPLGNVVVLQHADIDLWSAYCHLESIAVSDGEKVKQGDVIGYVGTSGMNDQRDEAAHLHMEIRGDSPDWGSCTFYDPADFVGGQQGQRDSWRPG